MPLFREATSSQRGLRFAASSAIFRCFKLGGRWQRKLREWGDYYNYQRPHGALDGQTPFERLLAKKESASVSPKS